MVASVIFFEIHINNIFKSPSGPTVVAAVMGVIILLQAVLNLPFIAIEYEWLNTLYGVSIMLGSLFIFSELFVMVQKRNI